MRLWDAATGKELQRLNHDGAVNAVTFNPDGKQLATASVDKTARLWLWQPEDLINELCSRLIDNLTWEEWQNYFEDEPYRKTCELLPVDLNYQETGKQLVKKGKMAEAIRMIQQLNAAEPALKLDQEQTLQKWTVTLRLQKAEQLANQGKTAEAVNMIQQLNTTDPALKLDQEKMLRKWTASIRLEEAEQLLKKKKITEAITAFNQVEQMDSKVISVDSWDGLCWYGAIDGHPAQVLYACEKAVLAATAEERWKYQDSRGLARALAGNIQGAIEDFETLIQETAYEKSKKQRQAWVQALRAGQNPFTKEELATLQAQ